MQKVIDFIDVHQRRYLDELCEFLRIPSVSTEPENARDVKRCAAWLAEHCKTIGLENVQVFLTKGHPIVYADWLHAGEDKPTVLLYGHYDVQPVDPIDLWTNPPFEPTIRAGKIYARGATDDKGQVFLHLKAIESWLHNEQRLPVNVKILIEGEEEIGSVNLDPFVEEHKKMLACDAVVISDTAMYRKGYPSIVYALRGLCYMEVRVSGPNRDLHSGSYGGAVQNPLNALAGMIAKLKDEKGRILIPGFYDDVLQLTDEERAEIASIDFDEGDYKDDLRVKELFGEDGYSTLERLGARPTLDVNGFIGGFTGSGAKTVLPAKASAKISMRLVANQNTNNIAVKFEKYIRDITPPGVTVEVENLHGANPVLVPRDSAAVKAAQRALETAFGQKPLFMREGGSIPITLLFRLILGAPTVLMGFGLHTENAHSPDENFDLDNFHTGIKAAAHFYNEMAQ